MNRLCEMLRPSSNQEHTWMTWPYLAQSEERTSENTPLWGILPGTSGRGVVVAGGRCSLLPALDLECRTRLQSASLCPVGQPATSYVARLP